MNFSPRLCEAGTQDDTSDSHFIRHLGPPVRVISVTIESPVLKSYLDTLEKYKQSTKDFLTQNQN